MSYDTPEAWYAAHQQYPAVQHLWRAYQELLQLYEPLPLPALDYRPDSEDGLTAWMIWSHEDYYLDLNMDEKGNAEWYFRDRRKEQSIDGVYTGPVIFAKFVHLLQESVED